MKKLLTSSIALMVSYAGPALAQQLTPEAVNTLIGAGSTALVIAGFVFLLPTLIASSRNHQNSGWIFILSLCGIFTYGILWLIALI